MTPDLFEEAPRDLPLGDGAMLLGGFALSLESDLLRALAAVVDAAPFRHMVTPGGHRMSVAMTAINTNCGAVGWVTDRTGYRYDPAVKLPRFRGVLLGLGHHGSAVTSSTAAS